MIRHAIATVLLALSIPTSQLLADELPASALTVLHHFSAAAAEVPTGKLLQAADGTLFGELTEGGANGGGAIFALHPNGTLNTLFSFGSAIVPEANANGSLPVGGLVFGPDGNLYGTTTFGGPSALGTVFRITPTGALTTLASFGAPGQGQEPFSRLMLASDGYLYGTTDSGDNSSGNIFRVDPSSGDVQTIYEFPLTGSPMAGPSTELVQGPDGALYGANSASVIRLPIGGQPTTLHEFSYQPANTMSGLVVGPDSALYGVSAYGPAGGFAYKITIDGTFTELHTFGCSCSVPEGAWPYNSLLLASDGNFYGVTVGGGLHNEGVLYRMTPAGVVTTLHSFTDADGAAPAGSLIEGSDGRLYGVTAGVPYGVATVNATVFKFALLPPAPTNVLATGATRAVTLNWNASRSASTYNIYLGNASGAESMVAAMSGITATTATVPVPAASTRYYLRVTAVNEAGESGASPEVSAVSLADAKSGGGGASSLLMLLLLVAPAMLRSRSARPDARG